MYGPFFPPPKQKQCSALDPGSMCDARRYHASNGSFYWDERRQGYCSTELPGPIGLPVLLDACPFCRCLLPGAKARKYWEGERPNPSLGQGDGE